MTEIDKIYRIAELNNACKQLLEHEFETVWVEGEISNFVVPSSGHWYFTLKDNEAQVRCAMFRGHNSYVSFLPEHGQQVLVQAKVSLYPARGDFQLIVQHIEEAGSGALQRAFEQLKAKLQQEGLFAEEHKQALPEIPQCIGVVTSASGAALHDILTVLKRRFASIPVIVYPTAVQGKEAADQIVAAINIANKRNECDVLIVGRGGGSLEDLWPFNEEKVARAIFASKIPIVSAVGHEVDITIADFVADVRAPTPSAAAELVSPNKEEWLQFVLDLRKSLVREISHLLQHHRKQLLWLRKSLKHPRSKLQEQAQHLDYLEQRLLHVWQQKTSQQRLKLNTLTSQLNQYSPQNQLTTYRLQCDNLQKNLTRNFVTYINQLQQKLIRLSSNLDTVSPLATLNRGYAIVNKGKAVIRSSKEVKIGDRVQTRLAQGSLDCRVENITE